MLKITIDRNRDPLTFKLEGRIAGEWVDELEQAWLEEVDVGKRIKIDLSGVTFVDEDGKKLLGRMFDGGSNLYATDCMNRSIIEEIKRKHQPRTGDGLDHSLHSQVR